MDKTSTGRKPRNIRRGNRKLIIQQYRDSPDLSVTELAGRIKLSRTTVMKINDSLLQDGIIEEAGKRASTEEGGKKPAVYRLNSNRRYILTFHIRYESICFHLFNLAMESLYTEIVEIEKDSPFPAVLKQLWGLYSRAGEKVPDLKEKLLSIMLAVHGTVDSQRGMCLHSTYFPSWGSDLPIAEKLKEALNFSGTVYADNWIRFKAYAAIQEPGVPEGTNLILIDAGEHGLTSGVIIKGEPYRGHHSFSGEIGHMILDLEDREYCGCGARGCFESLIKPERLIRDAQALKDRRPESALFRNTESESLDLKRILRCADEGDSLACSLMDKRILRFAQGLANVCVVFDPDIILLEGDYASGSSYFRKRVKESFQTMTLPRLEKDVEIKFSETPSISPRTLQGAAAYAFNSFFLANS